MKQLQPEVYKLCRNRRGKCIQQRQCDSQGGRESVVAAILSCDLRKEVASNASNANV